MIKEVIEFLGPYELQLMGRAQPQKVYVGVYDGHVGIMIDPRQKTLPIYSNNGRLVRLPEIDSWAVARMLLDNWSTFGKGSPPALEDIASNQKQVIKNIVEDLQSI